MLITISDLWDDLQQLSSLDLDLNSKIGVYQLILFLYLQENHLKFSQNVLYLLIFCCYLSTAILYRNFTIGLEFVNIYTKSANLLFEGKFYNFDYCIVILKSP